MKKTASVCVCFFAVTVMFCLQAIGADKQQFCRSYADTAVKQYNIAKQHNLPGIVPPAWSNDRNGHYNWCLVVPKNFATNENAKRQAYLDKHITKARPQHQGGSAGAAVTGTAAILQDMLPALPAVTGTSISTGGDTSYLGCFRDEKNRDLTGYSFHSPRMTKKLCMDTCRTRGFSYAGLQYGQYCFCGNTYGRLGKAGNCNMPCAGNHKETCGGGWANSMYRVKPGGSNNAIIAAAPNPANSTMKPGYTGSVASLMKKLQARKAVDFTLAQQLLTKRASSQNKQELSPYESPMFDIKVEKDVSQAAAIGKGYDSLSGYPKFPALAEIPDSKIRQLWAFNAHSTSDYVKNSEEYYKSLGLSVDVSGSYMGFSASSSTKYEENQKSNKFMETFAASSSIETQLRFPTLTDLQLNDTARSVLQNQGVEAFYQQYGDSFIYAIQYGAGFRGTISYDLFKKEEQYKFSTTATAGGWGIEAKVGYERTSRKKMESVNQKCVLDNYGVPVNTPQNVKELRNMARQFQQLAYGYQQGSTNPKVNGGVVGYTLIKYSNLPEFIQIAGADKLNLNPAKKLLARLTYYKRKIQRMRNNLQYVVDNQEKFSAHDRDAARKLLTGTVVPTLRSINSDIGQLQRNPFSQDIWFSLSRHINNYKRVSVTAPSYEYVKVIVDFPYEFTHKTPNQTMWNDQTGPLYNWPRISGDDQVDSSGHIDVNINSALEITPDKERIYLHQKLLIHENKPDHTRIGGKKRILVYTAPDDYKIVGLKQTRADYYHLRNLRGDGGMPVGDVLDRDNGAPAPKADDLWQELHVVFDNDGDPNDHTFVGLYGKLRMFVALEEDAPKE